MKEELRNESQAEISGGGKIRKIPFFCQNHFSAILPLGREPWSAVKLGQSGPARRSPERFRGEGGSNRCFWSKCPSNGENPNQGLSQCVAVSRSDFVKGPVKVPRPISEIVNVIHNERTVKTVKWFFAILQNATCCRPISSNGCQPNRWKN
jgi:hypothetical protein